MKVIIATVGRPKQQAFAKQIEAYIKRTRSHATVRIEHVREERRGSPTHVRAAESARLLGLVTGRAYRIALDEHGDTVTSIELSERFQNLMNRGHSTWILYIGGAHGHDTSLLEACNWTWSLSRLTLPHELALVFVTEQIYRAFSILAGSPYHKPG